MTLSGRKKTEYFTFGTTSNDFHVDSKSLDEAYEKVMIDWEWTIWSIVRRVLLYSLECVFRTAPYIRIINHFTHTKKDSKTIARWRREKQQIELKVFSQQADVNRTIQRRQLRNEMKLIKQKENGGIQRKKKYTNLLTKYTVYYVLQHHTLNRELQIRRKDPEKNEMIDIKSNRTKTYESEKKNRNETKTE